jgi:hypothetical protein
MFLLGQQNGDDPKSLMTYFASFEELKLPLKFDCQNPPIGRDNRLIEGSYVSGRLFKSNNVVTVLFGKVAEANFPIVITFTKSGARIDSLDLGGVCYSGPEGTIQTSFCKIESNKMFTIIDTMKSYILDKNGNEILSSLSVKVKYKQYRLKKSGVFVKVNSK